MVKNGFTLSLVVRTDDGREIEQFIGSRGVPAGVVEIQAAEGSTRIIENGRLIWEGARVGDEDTVAEKAETSATDSNRAVDPLRGIVTDWLQDELRRCECMAPVDRLFPFVDLSFMKTRFQELLAKVQA